MSDTNIIEPELRFHEGNTSFKVIEPVLEKPGVWYVQCSAMGAGFRRTSLKIIEMSEERIIKIYGDQLGRNALGNMKTIGIRAGERARRRAPVGRRLRWCFNHSGKVIAIPCG
jgi:hypothetical protein